MSKDELTPSDLVFDPISYFDDRVVVEDARREKETTAMRHSLLSRQAAFAPLGHALQRLFTERAIMLEGDYGKPTEATLTVNHNATGAEIRLGHKIAPEDLRVVVERDDAGTLRFVVDIYRRHPHQCDAPTRHQYWIMAYQQIVELLTARLMKV